MSHALKFVRQALRKKRYLNKRYRFEAILYRDWDHWAQNHAAHRGLSDIDELENIAQEAEPGNVIDVFVYVLDDPEWDEFGELADQVVVEIPMTARGKIRPEANDQHWRSASGAALELRNDLRLRTTLDQLPRELERRLKGAVPGRLGGGRNWEDGSFEVRPSERLDKVIFRALKRQHIDDLYEYASDVKVDFRPEDAIRLRNAPREAGGAFSSAGTLPILMSLDDDGMKFEVEFEIPVTVASKGRRASRQASPRAPHPGASLYMVFARPVEVKSTLARIGDDLERQLNGQHALSRVSTWGDERGRGSVEFRVMGDIDDLIERALDDAGLDVDDYAHNLKAHATPLTEDLEIESFSRGQGRGILDYEITVMLGREYLDLDIEIPVQVTYHPTRAASIKDQLVELGKKNASLRPHLRAVIASLMTPIVQELKQDREVAEVIPRRDVIEVIPKNLEPMGDSSDFDGGDSYRRFYVLPWKRKCEALLARHGVKGQVNVAEDGTILIQIF